MRSVRLLACAGLLGLVGISNAVAQIYPDKPVRIIVPMLAGSDADFIVRPVARKMSESLKQTFIVDNRPGAAGTIGVELAARAAPDGYMLLFGAVDHVALPPALYDKLVYDVARDLVPISQLADAPFALFAHPSLGVKSVRELVALAKARPGKIAYASLGTGSFTRFLTETLNAATGIKLIHVPYKDGAQAASALLGGEVMAGFHTLREALPHLRANRLRALALGAAKRAPVAPEIPTFAEAGYPNVGASAWFGLFAPINTPQDVIVKLHAEAIKTLAQREIRDHFERAGIEAVGSTPEQFSQQVRSDIAKFGRIAREAGIRAE